MQDQDGTDCSEVGGSECLGPLVTPPVGRDDHGGTEKGGSEGETKGQTKVKFCRNKGPRTHTHTHTLGCPGQVGMNVRTKTKAKILATNTLHTPRGLFPLPLSSCNLLCTYLPCRMSTAEGLRSHYFSQSPQDTKIHAHILFSRRSEGFTHRCCFL